MTTRWEQVRAWRDRLRTATIATVQDDLSESGLRAGLHAALDGLSDDALARVAALQGRAWPTALVITTATVPTAALEWIALLLGRGSVVTWKHPTGRPGLAPILAELAHDLPLTITAERDAIDHADAIIVLGSDETVAAVRAQAPRTAHVIGHGHAWSCAWITGAPLPDDPRIPSEFRDPWGRVAADATLYDGRGCLSPAIVFTPLPLEQALDALGDAMRRAATRWPMGTLHPSEAALERSRRAHTRVVGAYRRGEGWSLHGVGVHDVSPAALPRSIAVVAVPDLPTATGCAARWGSSLSTVATDDPSAAEAWLQAGATRICAPGRMQRPPLDRVHDGVRWVHQTFIATDVEHATP